MIPRYQRILFWTLVGGILIMALFLLRGWEQAHKRLNALNASPAIAAPTNTTTEDITLDLANDLDGSITATHQQLALPQDPTVRARALLEHLIAVYALPDSTHPLPAGPDGSPAIDDVFLLNLPIPNPVVATLPNAHAESATPVEAGAGQLAVINLRHTFVDAHPSGVLTENLTLQSIIGTLHANFPHLTQVRFLVDGQPRDTLSGHADLRHTYPATDTASKPTPPEAPKPEAPKSEAQP